jgi:alcohol dehydrogenase
VRGLVFLGQGDIEVRDDLPEPRLQAPTDALLRVTRAGLCGSDLHPYEGREPARAGVVPGHEAVGEVLAIGSEVHRVRPGDRVLAAFTTSCGRCPACDGGRTSRCEQGALFGWGDPDHRDVPALDGAQAELLRVPLADGTLVHVPEQLDDATAVLLTDNLPTGWTAARRAEVVDGDLVVVLGLGAVGLCAVMAARTLGAGTVVAIDPVAGRRAAAEAVGADHLGDPGLAAQLVTGLTERGRELGADAVVDATGAASGLRLGFELLRAGGRLSVIGVQTAASLPVAPAEAYDRDLTIRFGRAPARAALDEVLPAVLDGRLLVPTDAVLTHPSVPLADGPALYRAFASRDPGLVKAAFAP